MYKGKKLAKRATHTARPDPEARTLPLLRVRPSTGAAAAAAVGNATPERQKTNKTAAPV